MNILQWFRHFRSLTQYTQAIALNSEPGTYEMTLHGLWPSHTASIVERPISVVTL